MKNQIANIVSGMFHPVLMVTYGIILALTYTYLAIFPMQLKCWIVGGVFLLTSFVPALFVWIMVKVGIAGDMDLKDRRDRTVPFLISATSMVATAFFLNRMMMPSWVVIELMGACVALFIAMIINSFWKISVHSIGIGGLLGGIMGTAYLQMTNPATGMIIGFIIAGIVGTSRLILKRHTPMQVYAGFLLGFICVFVSALLSFIFLFI